METVKIENILSQIRKLDYEDGLYLAEQLIKQLRRTKNEPKSYHHLLTELNSLGSEVWQDMDIDKYVEQERQWE